MRRMLTTNNVQKSIIKISPNNITPLQLAPDANSADLIQNFGVLYRKEVQNGQRIIWPDVIDEGPFISALGITAAYKDYKFRFIVNGKQYDDLGIRTIKGQIELTYYIYTKDGSHSVDSSTVAYRNGAWRNEAYKDMVIVEMDEESLPIINYAKNNSPEFTVDITALSYRYVQIPNYEPKLWYAHQVKLAGSWTYNGTSYTDEDGTTISFYSTSPTVKINDFYYIGSAINSRGLGSIIKAGQTLYLFDSWFTVSNTIGTTTSIPSGGAIHTDPLFKMFFNYPGESTPSYSITK